MRYSYAAEEGDAHVMDLEELERLVDLVQSANIRELTLKHNESRVTIRKAATPVVSQALMPYAEEFDTEEEAQLPNDHNTDLQFEPEDHTVPILSPLVGVFRHTRPLVGLGAHVKQGQKVGEIEAMKILNEVTAPASGKVVDLLVEDGQPVEYGQELYAIEPDEV